MNIAEESTINIIRLLVTNNDKDAQEEFLRRLNKKHFLQKAYNSSKFIDQSKLISYNSYVAFFWIQLFDKGKLVQCLRKYNILSETEQMEDEDNFVYGYLYKTAKTAFIDMLKAEKDDWDYGDLSRITIPGNRNHEDGGNSSFEEYIGFFNEEPRYSESRKSETSISLEKLKALFLELPRKSRISIWLKRMVGIIPLPDEDLQYLAEKNNCTTNRILRLIDDEVEKNLDNSKTTGYVSTKFLSSLQSVSVDVIDQRVKRAMIRISEHTAISDVDVHDG